MYRFGKLGCAFYPDFYFFRAFASSVIYFNTCDKKRQPTVYPLFSTKFFACLLTVELLFFIKNKLFFAFLRQFTPASSFRQKNADCEKIAAKRKNPLPGRVFFCVSTVGRICFLLISTPFRFAYSRAAPLRRFSVLRKISDYPVYDCAGNLLFKFVGS